MSKSYHVIYLNGDVPEFYKAEDGLPSLPQVDLVIGDTIVSLVFDSGLDAELFCREHNIEYVPSVPEGESDE